MNAFMIRDSAFLIQCELGAIESVTQGRSNRGTDTEIRLLIPVSVPEIIIDCSGPEYHFNCPVGVPAAYALMRILSSALYLTSSS
jgi:hypothetical protein